SKPRSPRATKNERQPSTGNSCGRSTRRRRGGRSTGTRRRARSRRPRACSAAQAPSSAGGDSLARTRQLDERAAELELACEPAATFEREIELGQPHERIAQLVGCEVPGLLEQLLHVEPVLLQLLGGVSRRGPFGGECLALGDPRDVAGQQ